MLKKRVYCKRCKQRFDNIIAKGNVYLCPKCHNRLSLKRVRRAL